MKAPTDLLRSVAGLFVDDGSLALAIIVTVASATLVAILLPGVPVAAGIVLLVGCVGVLFGNVMRARGR